MLSYLLIIGKKCPCASGTSFFTFIILIWKVEYSSWQWTYKCTSKNTFKNNSFYNSKPKSFTSSCFWQYNKSQCHTLEGARKVPKNHFLKDRSNWLTPKKVSLETSLKLILKVIVSGSSPLNYFQSRREQFHLSGSNQHSIRNLGSSFPLLLVAHVTRLHDGIHLHDGGNFGWQVDINDVTVFLSSSPRII